MLDFKFDWDSSIEIGIPKIDVQHKELFRIARSIEQVILTNGAGLDDNQLLHILCELREYVTYHFYEEETFMQQMSYPEFLPHKAFHDAFIKVINAIDCDNLLVSIKSLKEILQNWLFEHILTQDTQIKVFLKTKGPSPSI